MDETIKKIKTINIRVIKKVCNKIKNLFKNEQKLLFFIFLILYFILGMLLSYNYKLENILDLLFNSDTNRIITDMSEIFTDHYRLNVHPLFVIITQPIYFLVSGIIQDRMISLLLISSIISALSVTFIYKTIYLYSKEKKLAMLIAICYGFSFSNIIYTASIEIYNIVAFTLILFWYFISKSIKEKWHKNSLIVFITLGILALSITITNYVVFLIGCLTLLISKTVGFKKIILANIIIITMTIGLSYFQNYIWQNTPILTNSIQEQNEKNKKYTRKEEFRPDDERIYIDFSFKMTKVKTVVRNCLYNSLISGNIQLEKKAGIKPVIVFENISILNKIIITTFFAIIIFFTLKNFKKNVSINIGIILSILFNFILHIVYGNDGQKEACFLYSMHFTYLIFLLAGINFVKENNKKLQYISFGISFILLIAEILINNKMFFKIIEIISSLKKSNYFAQRFCLTNLILGAAFVIIMIIIASELIIYFVKKAKKSNDSMEKAKYAIFIFVCIILIGTIFVSIKTIPKYQKILWIDLRL